MPYLPQGVVVEVRKLSDLIIDTNKNWLGYTIKNLGAPADPDDSARKTDVDAVQSNLDTHRTSSVLDHPDGSVTSAKLKVSTGSWSVYDPSWTTQPWWKVTMNRYAFMPNAYFEDSTSAHAYDWRVYLCGQGVYDVPAESTPRVDVTDTGSTGVALRFFLVWDYVSATPPPELHVLVTPDMPSEQDFPSYAVWVGEPEVDPPFTLHIGGEVRRPKRAFTFSKLREKHDFMAEVMKKRKLHIRQLEELLHSYSGKKHIDGLWKKTLWLKTK